ncbi:LysR family transcriptional regulator [Glacieibacterium megasporae]|uniref:LysR family transcriptional regulator n=1 Tax=Glacieibacterium megasporae TaxID=2835787 RepID=UPI001C1E427E|nr:LysR family transcriptional regulator [Polymorphobacter megasporae]UAJ12300.1 LysR family transcriptional regulator [Polymorphobacter megasporae]
MELNDLRAFARTADIGSVSGAARSLGLPKSTVSRALTRLEADIGALLIDRSTRHLRLTDAGMLFHPYATRILADVDEAGTALDNFTGIPRGTLRISAPFTFVVALVAPMLPDFLARYPEIRVILDVENRIIDMPVEPADLVIRVGTLPDSDLIARHLLATEAWTCASPGYLAAYGIPASVADLRRHTMIGYADRQETWSYRRSSGDVEHFKFSAAHAVSDSIALEAMLIAGGGIGRLPDFIARRAVATGDLMRLFPETTGDTLEVNALYTSHRSLSAKVRAFIDALIGHLSGGQG